MLWGARDLAIDLGTANTLVYTKDRGIVVREPSVVAVRTDTQVIEAVGEPAKLMIGRTPGNIRAIRPMKDGVIADFETTAIMIKYFMKQVRKGRFNLFNSPRVMVCVPAGITTVEHRAVIDATLQAGAKEAYTIEEPFAAALGANLPIWEARGSMVVDIGGGTTEVAIIAFGGVVASRSLRVAGDALDSAIVNYMKKMYNLLVGERTAEQLKLDVGSALHQDNAPLIEVRGRDLVSGLPKTLLLTTNEITEALTDTLKVIVDAVKATLEKCPPELAADIIDRGIALTGGGALLRNLDKHITLETGIPVFVAEDPLDCVVMGTAKALEDLRKVRTRGGPVTISGKVQ